MGLRRCLFQIKSILVICQELFEEDFDMFFRKKGNFNRPSVYFTYNRMSVRLKMCIRDSRYLPCGGGSAQGCFDCKAGRGTAGRHSVGYLRPSGNFDSEPADV